MNFSFKFGDTSHRPVCINMALEYSFADGKVVQVLNTSSSAYSTLVYRMDNTGKWLSSSGISFNGLPHTPENLIKSMGLADPVGSAYVMPAA